MSVAAWFISSGALPLSPAVKNKSLCLQHSLSLLPLSLFTCAVGPEPSYPSAM